MVFKYGDIVMLKENIDIKDLKSKMSASLHEEYEDYKNREYKVICNAYIINTWGLNDVVAIAPLNEVIKGNKFYISESLLYGAYIITQEEYMAFIDAE